MSNIPDRAAHSSQFKRQPGDLRDGSLPQRAPYVGEFEGGGLVGQDGFLHVGAFRLSSEAMMRSLDSFARIAKRIERIFPDKGSLARVLPDGEIPVPLACMSFPAAFETFKEAQSQALRDVDFFRIKRAIEGLQERAVLSKDELATVRDLLMKGARLATVCAGIDQAIEVAHSYRSMTQRGRDWLMDRAGSLNVQDPRIKAKLREMPFEEFGVQCLRIDADLMAQRIALGEDGSPAVRDVCLAEHRAARLLLRGQLSRDVSLSRAGLQGALAVHDAGGSTVYNATHCVPEVFSALQLGGSASRLLSILAEE